MENNQSTQQSSELGDSKLAHSSRRNASSNNLNSLLMLLNRWPWLTWLGVSVLLFAITAISIRSLIYPISLSPEPEPKTVAVKNPTETSSQTGSLSLWLAGAAALTFAAGSLVIFKRLNSSSHSDIRRRSSRRSLTRRQQRKVLLQGPLSSPTQPELLLPIAPIPVEIEPVVMLPLEESQSFDSGEESLAEMLDDCLPFSASDLTVGKFSNAESEPVVTVLPPESIDLVNLEEESLAEIMDIRRHRSLSSILQDSKI